MTTPWALLDCQIELTRPYGHGVWWDTTLVGTPAQIGAALDELAVRIGVDTLTRIVSWIDPQVEIGYELAVSGGSSAVLDCTMTLPLADLPSQLRAHAAEIRLPPSTPDRGEGGA